MSDNSLDMSGCKKRKRGERVFKFKTFGEKGYPVKFDNVSNFEENVRGLLDFGQPEIGGAMANWSFQLEVGRHPLMYVFLFVVEEPVELSPLGVRCKHCQYIGWGNNMICNKNYHFVLPMSSKAKVTELHVQGGETDYIHSMHGVFHSNGFGHLLRINGWEAGSQLSGQQIMDFWDRLCFGLGARKVSLRDTATKKGMDLRLLHSIGYGKPWFGRWDYVFGRGSFCVTQEMYQNAVKMIQNIPLSLLISNHQRQFANELQILFSGYQSQSGHSLMTLGDLFHFMLDLKSQLPKDGGGCIDLKYSGGILSDASCRWSPKRVAMAIHVVVEALKRAEFRWVSRQHVRDVARAYIGDTGLLDFVLKSLGNHVVGKYFVRRCLNPVTKVLKYCLEDVVNAFPRQEPFQIPNTEPNQAKITWSKLMEDVLYMDRNIFQKASTSIILPTENDVFATIQVASRLILDSKHLVKEYCNETQTKNMNPYQDSDLVFAVKFEGNHGGYSSTAREVMIVDCICGTKDDDGERMVCCDVCQVWQHSLCVQIPDDQQIPHIFLCSSCERGLLSFPANLP